MRIGFIPLDTAMQRVGDVASTRFRVRWVSEYIPDSIISDSMAELQNCDVVIFQSRMGKNDLELAKNLKADGVKLMLDLTDPEWYPPYLKGASPPEYLNDMVETVDVITLASKGLEKLFKGKHRGKTKVIPDRLDLKRHSVFKKHYDKTDSFKIIWFGSYGNLDCVDDLARVDLEKLGAELDIELVMVYDRIGEFSIKNIPSNFKYTVKEWNKETINDEIVKCDVSINPKYDDWRSYKTNNKSIKSWALGVPCVERDFYKEIKLLLKSGKLRNELAGINRKSIEEDYDVRLSAKEILEISKELTKTVKHKKKKNKIAVITAIDGGKDYLKEVDKEFRDGADFIAFTDEDYLSDTWDVRPIRKFFATPCLNAKIYKVLMHQFTEDYEYTLWVDGTIVPKSPILLMVDTYLKTADMAVFKHSQRDCIYKEHEVIMQLRRDRPDILMKAINKYRKTHPANAGLYECGILLRHNTKKMEDFNNAWWSEITTFTECDQIPFMYLARKMGIKINDFDTGNMYVSKMFKYEDHVKPLKPVTDSGYGKIDINKLLMQGNMYLIKRIGETQMFSKVGNLSPGDYFLVSKDVGGNMLSSHPEDFELIKSN